MRIERAAKRRTKLIGAEPPGPAAAALTQPRFDHPGGAPAKVVKARTLGDARKEESPIRSLEKSNTQLILQGVENGHGWGMAIDQTGGRMTATIAGESASFMIFGVCTAL